MFAAIVYRPVGVGKQRTHAAHVLPGPYASRQLAHQAGVAYAKQKRLSPLDVGTLEASKVGQFFQGTGSHYIRENPSLRRSMKEAKKRDKAARKKWGAGATTGATVESLRRAKTAARVGKAMKKARRKIAEWDSSIQDLFRNPGPSALPSKWTPATVTRKGRQIQIRVGGR